MVCSPTVTSAYVPGRGVARVRGMLCALTGDNTICSGYDWYHRVVVVFVSFVRVCSVRYFIFVV